MHGTRPVVRAPGRRETQPTRDPRAEGPEHGVVFSLRRAARKGRRTSPPDGEPLETGVVLDIQPDAEPGRVEVLRVRSLRTQQRAESQCQVITPCLGSFRRLLVGIPLVD